MKRLLLVFAVASMLTGCTSLYMAMTPVNHPQVGEKFQNFEGQIRVEQIADGFVLARSTDYQNTLLVRINTKHNYASGEYLIPGGYIYVGNWTVSIPGHVYVDGPKVVREFNDPTIEPERR